MAIKLTAGQETEHHAVGRHFRIMTTEVVGNIGIRITSKGREIYKGELSAGIGIDFSDRIEYPDPFDKIYIKSSNTQNIVVWAELAKADDDRLAASATVVVSTAGKTANVPVKIALSDTVNGHVVLPALDTRRTATYQTDVDCYLFDAVNGVLLPAGIYEWGNHSALTLIPTAAGTFKCLEEGE